MFAEFHHCGEIPLRTALNEAMRFCGAMASASEPARWLTLLGPSGTGKTMLAKIITRFFRRHLDGLEDENTSSPTAKYLRRGGLKAWAGVMQDMLDGDFSGIRDLKDDWFVCLDDIGAEHARNRELSISKLYDILNARAGKFTVITANLTLEEVNRTMDARIASRLLRHGSVVVDVAAMDYNLRDMGAQQQGA